MSEGIVFDIQHYAVHDGPGIRTLVFLKGCPMACSWCCNPESQRFEPELTHNGARCRACYACRKACPLGAVSVGEEGPLFGRGTCDRCASRPCVDACPQGALSVAGTRMTADQVTARVGADRAFYLNSGGGVTFTGGEPFAQPDFLKELLARSRDLGIHTAVETCGLADPRVVAECEPLADLFFFDLKIADRARHAEMTGVPNDAILQNLKALAAKRPGDVTVRVPLVPGCTDGDDNISAIGALLASLGIRRVQVMPYHPLGADKYAALGRRYTLGRVQVPDHQALRACLSRLARFDLDCLTDGP